MKYGSKMWNLYRKYGHDNFDRVRAIYRRKKGLPWESSYNSIKQRCENPRSVSFQYYGARGIKCMVTPRELMMAYFRDGGSRLRNPHVDRIDNDGHYVLSNIQWLGRKAHAKKSGLEFKQRASGKKRKIREVYYLRRVLRDGSIGDPVGPFTKQQAEERSLIIMKAFRNVERVAVIPGLALRKQMGIANYRRGNCQNNLNTNL